MIPQDDDDEDDELTGKSPEELPFQQKVNGWRTSMPYFLPTRSFRVGGGYTEDPERVPGEQPRKEGEHGKHGPGGRKNPFIGESPEGPVSGPR